MAILRNQDISDDEFDMIEPEPVSDLSTPEPDAHGGNHFTPLSPPKAADSISARLSGPSTASVKPKRGTWDTESYAVAPASHDATSGSDDQRTYASTFGTNKSTNNTEAGRTSEGIPGLKYTKSVYQKLWGGKDALIAVMGYVTHPAVLGCLFATVLSRD